MFLVRRMNGLRVGTLVLLLILTTCALVPVASSGATTPLHVIKILSPDEAKERDLKLRREWAPRCRRAWSRRKNLDRIFNDLGISDNKLSDLSRYLSEGRHGCRKTPELALRIMGRIVGENPLATENVYFLKQLVQIHKAARRPDSDRRILELERILWIRTGHVGGLQIFQTEQERRDFIARNDIWAYLLSQDNRQYLNNHHHILDALFDPLSPRFDPGGAIQRAVKRGHLSYKVKAAKLLIDGQLVARDMDRAEALLWGAARLPEAVSMLLPIVASRLQSSDATIRDDTASALFEISKQPFASNVRDLIIPYYRKNLRDESHMISIDAARKLEMLTRMHMDTAADPLLDWVDQKLESRNREEKEAAQLILAKLVLAHKAGARAVLEKDIRRTGGVVQTNKAEGLQILQKALEYSHRYPVPALRERREGVVSVDLLVSPSRRALEAFVMKTSGFEDIDSAAIKSAIRFSRLKFPELPDRYVRMTLPDIQFRLPRCSEQGEITPLLEGAIVIEAQCLRW
ncbi:energy transducer TonB [Sphingorhabdus sp. YGSMI21]|uniref:energy transducer TonB n=1 Tax=Sphingorhabdus sp. YGSMI21 TaxID=2077182 RepID=UPI000C1F7271|nr:energy transducer TonB [Sphingorhabdus sp. YGSMI21]ATW04988.1 hypothetical protein CHN51_16715 [Sphingorhabdus sp. YGSMI21]